MSIPIPPEYRTSANRIVEKGGIVNREIEREISG
jgi:hypothetical protein